MTDIDVSASPVQTLSVKLLGIEYTLTPPKSATAIKIARMAKDDKTDALDLIDALHEWLKIGFGKQAPKILKRLDSNADPLDYPHLIALVKKVMEKQSGDPTT